MSQATKTLIIMLALLLAASAAVSAQRQTAATDEQIQALVAKRLRDAHIVGVQVSVSGQVVTLRGTVSSLWVKNEALERARKTRHVGSVISELAIVRAENDNLVAEDVAELIRGHVQFTIFDDAEVGVTDGIVTLTGKVTTSSKAHIFADLASRVRGVQDVRNRIETLPASTLDDELRYTIGSRIYSDPVFWNLAVQSNPPVHIIVERGRVTLVGVVSSEVERRTAETIARSTFGVFGVTNKLRLAED